MFNVGGGELLVILLIALIVLGPDRLPGFAKTAGKAMREVRRISNGFQTEIRQAMDLDETSPAKAPSTTTPRLLEPPPVNAPEHGTTDVGNQPTPPASTAEGESGPTSDTSAA